MEQKTLRINLIDSTRVPELSSFSLVNKLSLHTLSFFLKNHIFNLCVKDNWGDYT